MLPVPFNLQKDVNASKCVCFCVLVYVFDEQEGSGKS